MLGEQNRAGHRRDSTFVLTFMAVLKGWESVEEESQITKKSHNIPEEGIQ